MTRAPSRLRGILGHLLSGTSVSLPPAPPPAPPPHIHCLSPTHFLPRAAAIEPDAQAIFHVTRAGTELVRSYAEFADRARGLAFYLRKHGRRRVGIVAPNTPAFLECIFGVAAAEAVIVPVNYRLKADDVAYILDFGRVDCIVVDEEYVDLLCVYKRLHPDTSILVDMDTDGHGGMYDAALQEGLIYDQEKLGGHGWNALQSAQSTHEDTMLAIPFTSGTTSRPKGVVYTHRGAYLAALANVIESNLNTTAPFPRCTYLWTLPMFHAIGWTFPWAVTAVRGTHVCLRRIDYPLIWRLLRERAITHFNAAPTVNTFLCADPDAQRLEHPVRVTVAASPPTAHLFGRMTALNLQPVHVYGLTETYGPITKGYILPTWEVLPSAEKYARMARQGYGFITSLPVRVVEPGAADRGQLIDVPRDGSTVGEVVFFGNICAKEYYRDEEATRKLFAGGGLHSGDLAVWHADGSIQIMDRAKDVIISGGENISSVALEAMLVQHPEVLEVGVVALADDKWGERPKAYVTKVKDGTGLTPEGLIAWAKDQSAISRFMVPREVEIVAELPKTSTGKIQKNVLREWAKRGRNE